eukprot:scaffold495_cov243-Pinguiococcus_pyrenoidosus.AAC.15
MNQIASTESCVHRTDAEIQVQEVDAKLSATHFELLTPKIPFSPSKKGGRNANAQKRNLIIIDNNLDIELGSAVATDPGPRQVRAPDPWEGPEFWLRTRCGGPWHRTGWKVGHLVAPPCMHRGTSCAGEHRFYDLGAPGQFRLAREPGRSASNSFLLLLLRCLAAAAPPKADACRPWG